MEKKLRSMEQAQEQAWNKRKRSFKRRNIWNRGGKLESHKEEHLVSLREGDGRSKKLRGQGSLEVRRARGKGTMLELSERGRVWR